MQLAAGHLLTVATGRGASMQLAHRQGRHSKRGIRAKRFNVDTDFTGRASRKGKRTFAHILIFQSLLLAGSSLISTLGFFSLFTVTFKVIPCG